MSDDKTSLESDKKQTLLLKDITNWFEINCTLEEFEEGSNQLMVKLDELTDPTNLVLPQINYQQAIEHNLQRVKQLKKEITKYKATLFRRKKNAAQMKTKILLMQGLNTGGLLEELKQRYAEYQRKNEEDEEFVARVEDNVKQAEMVVRLSSLGVLECEKLEKIYNGEDA